MEQQVSEIQAPKQPKTESNRQQGFSLIELLVVVAIIGVLSSAGIVGYQRYLDGVKADTHKGNAKTLAAALKTSAVARTSGLTVSPPECADAATPVTQGVCAKALGKDFKSPFVSTKIGNAYFADGTGAVPTYDAATKTFSVTTCAIANKGLLVIYSTDTAAALVACGNDETAKILAVEALPAGSEWATN